MHRIVQVQYVYTCNIGFKLIGLLEYAESEPRNEYECFALHLISYLCCTKRQAALCFSFTKYLHVHLLLKLYVIPSDVFYFHFLWYMYYE